MMNFPLDHNCHTISEGTTQLRRTVLWQW